MRPRAKGFEGCLGGTVVAVLLIGSGSQKEYGPSEEGPTTGGRKTEVASSPMTLGLLPSFFTCEHSFPICSL